MKIYLDFDGVIHPYQEGSFSRVPILERLIVALQKPRIIISSNWRVSMTLKELKAQFPEHLRSLINDVTPEISDPTVKRPKQAEIMAYEKNRPSPFIVLDDDASLFEDNWKHLVLIDPSKGLQASDIPEAIRVMSQAPAANGLSIRPGVSMVG